MSDSDGSKCGPLNSSSISNFDSCSSYQSTTTYTPPPSCPSGQWWDYATNSCTSSTYTPYPTTQSCPSGQWWDYSTSSCKTTSTTDCPSGWYWNGSSCVSSETTTPYPTTEYTPYPTTEYTPPPPTSYNSIQHQIAVANTIMSCAESGDKWDASRSRCKQSFWNFFIGNISGFVLGR